MALPHRHRPPRRRLPSLRGLAWGVAGVVVLAVAAAAWTAWTAWQVQADLRTAQEAADRFGAAVADGDDRAADLAAADLATSAAAAHDRTDGLWWGGVGHLPGLGDDAQGVARVARVLDLLATEGVGPLRRAADLVDRVSVDGRIDLDTVHRLEGPVAAGDEVFAEAERDLAGLDPDGMLAPLASRYARLQGDVASFADGFAAARTAVEVLPGLAGEDGPRRYLLVFQNNAEIRATGGLPGSWAVLRADDGRLSLGEQGAADDFPALDEPVLPLTPAEQAVYDEQLGTYFQDATVTPDFPRAAALMAARWQRAGGEPLDGVLSLDTVALAYLLRGTGPIEVAGVPLDEANVVEVLLSDTYAELPDPQDQDAWFEAVTRGVFDAVTGPLDSPAELVRGMGAAAGEGRFLVRSFHAGEQRALAGTRVAGELRTGPGGGPVVDVSVNDATGAKMSYYLGYDVLVTSEGCDAGVQSLAGRLALGSALQPDRVDDLPAYVTGGGTYGTEPGSQLLLVRLHAPVGGDLTDIRVGGRPVTPDLVEQRGRPTATVVVLLGPGDGSEVTWRMTSGPGQRGDTEVRVTPGIVPGDASSVVPSGC